MSVVSRHEPRLVGDLMALEPIVVRADMPLTVAAVLMDRHGISGLPVVDGGGTLVGVISDTDLLRSRATEYLWANWPGLRVKHLMTSPALTSHRDESLTVAARKMERHRVGRLVVVADDDETLPIGVIAIADLIRAMAALPPEEAPEAEPDVDAGPPPDAVPDETHGD